MKLLTRASLLRILAYLAGAGIVFLIPSIFAQTPLWNADRIVKGLVAKYQGDLKAAQIGKPFHEVYNLETLEPRPEWQTIYEEACLEMEQAFGLKLAG